MTSPDGTRELNRGKPVALLAFLAASPGRRASRERLASLLWSDGSSESARQNLRQTIWYIKRRLGDWLVASDDFLELVPDVDVDRDRFLIAVREQRLKDAVALYGGEFIPDFAAPGAADFEQWADVERRRLRGIFVGCCDTLARQELASGHFQAAVELAKRARDAAPLDFATWRLLLESLTSARDAIACVAEIEHLEALASAEDLEIDDATRAALRAARAMAAGSGQLPAAAGANEPHSSSTADAAADAGGFAPELIGRESEFRSLLALWDAAKDGRGSAVLIAGVAGLGKSRLLADFFARLRASRARALLIRANPGDRAVSGGFLAAVAEAVAQRPGAAAISEESASVLVALAPALASAFPRARADAATGEDALRRRANALLDLVRAVSEESALALLIDDIHWADAESRRVLDALSARLDGGRVLLVLAARPPLETLGGFATLTRFELSRFDLPRVAEFVTRLGELPPERWAAHLPSQLLAATRGIPLALVETLARLVELGALALREHQWTSEAPVEIGEVLRAGMVLEARVRSLSAGARELLLFLAVAGRPVPVRDLRLAEPDDARLLEIEHRGLLIRRDDALIVAHDEIAAASLGSATVEQRREAHRQACEILLTGVPSSTLLRLAVRHAIDADDPTQLDAVVRRWVRWRRAGGDGASATTLVRDLLGSDVPPPWHERARGSIPLWERPSRWMLRAAAFLLIATGGIAFGNRWRDTPPPQFEAIVRLDEGPVRWARAVIKDVSKWEPGRPVVLESLRDAEVPAPVRTLRHVHVRELSRGGEWLGQAFFGDSGGQDIFVADAQGNVTRVASAPGDDGVPVASPDRRLIAFATARWHRATDTYNIAVFDRTTGELRRLVPSADLQATPQFSPDGTRLVYSRHSLTEERPRDFCIVGLDGIAPDCDWPGAEGRIAVAWLDDVRLLVQDAAQGEWSVLDTESRRFSPIAGRPQTYIFARAGIGVDYPQLERDGVPGLMVTKIGEPSSSRPLLLDGRPVRGEIVAVAERVPKTWIDRLALVEPPDGVPVDVRFRLRAQAFDSAGRPRRAPPARFRSLDDSIAGVRGATLMPRRVGTVRIEVSLGGVHVDTGAIRITPSTLRHVFEEDWLDGWSSRWRSFGEPSPRIGAGDGASVFEPNGDGRFPSGAYSTRLIPGRDGVGVELRVSTPFTEFQWQSVTVELTPGPRAQLLDAWDHRTGDWPEQVASACAFGHGGDGADAFTHFSAVAALGTRVRREATALMRSGRFYTLRIQLFPDGRCGIAVNGLPLALTADLHPVADSLRLRLLGHSHRTRIAFGSLDVWTGVKGDVDWSILEAP